MLKDNNIYCTYISNVSLLTGFQIHSSLKGAMSWDFFGIFFISGIEPDLWP